MSSTPMGTEIKDSAGETSSSLLDWAQDHGEDTQANREQGDFKSFLLFFQNKENRLKRSYE
jgi:hypothetical protein